MCVDAPEDRATLSLTLVLPAVNADLKMDALFRSATCGRPKRLPSRGNRIRLFYIFLVLLRSYRIIREKKYGVEFQYLITSFTDDEARRIFATQLTC